MEILHLTKDNFHDEIAAGTALVDFWAGWCMPCKMLGPVIEEIAEELRDSVKTAKVDVDAEGELALEYGVMSIPTVIVFRDGLEAKRFVGVQPKEIYMSFLQPEEDDVTAAEDVNLSEEE
jgi:thioredoxin 1